MINTPVALLIYQLLAIFGIAALATLVSFNSSLDFRFLFQQGLIDKIKNFNQYRASGFQKAMIVFLTLISGLMFFLPTLLMYGSTISDKTIETYLNRKIVPATAKDIVGAQPGKKFQFPAFNDLDMGETYYQFQRQGDFDDVNMVAVAAVPLYAYLLSSLLWNHNPNPTGTWFNVAHVQQNALITPQNVNADDNDPTNVVNIVSNSTVYLVNYKVRAAQKYSQACLPTVEFNLPITLASSYPAFKASLIDDTGTLTRKLREFSQAAAKMTIKMSSFNFNSTHITTAVKKSSRFTLFNANIEDITTTLACSTSYHDADVNEVPSNKILCELEQVFNENPMYPAVEATLRSFKDHTAVDVIFTRSKSNDGLHAITVDINTFNVYTIEGGNFYDDNENLVANLARGSSNYFDLYSKNTIQEMLESANPHSMYYYGGDSEEQNIAQMTLMTSRLSRNDFSDFNLISDDVLVQNFIETNASWCGMVLGLGIPFLIVSLYGLKSNDLRSVLVKALVPKIDGKNPPVKFGLNTVNPESSEKLGSVLNIDGNTIVLKSKQ